MTELEQRLRETFNPFNAQHRAECPNLFAFYADSLQFHSEDLLRELVKTHGPIPVKLYQTKTDFNEPTFEWSPDEYTDNDEGNDDLNLLYDAIHDATDTGPGVGTPADDELEIILERVRVASNSDYVLDYVYGAIDEFVIYTGHLKVFEQSTVASELRAAGTNYMYERRRYDPLLVIPDSKAAMLMKLKYG